MQENHEATTPGAIVALAGQGAEGWQRFVQLLERRCIELVPEIYRQPHACELTPTYDERRTAAQLLDPILWFVTGELEPESLLDRLKSASTPPQLCGRMFKPGEPNYSCRECSTDHTCVMCVDCFKNSVHRNHRYRIHTSSSGYCDCGDAEAWKRDPICMVHAQQYQQSLEAAMSNLVPDARMQPMADRLRAVTQWLLDYAFLVLKWPGSQLPDPLRNGTADDMDRVVVLYNDETHTYDHVIKALHKSIKCDEKQATEYATAVDREGRRVIYHGNEERCRHVANIIADITRKNSDRVLEVKVMTGALVAHQTFAVRLLSWLMEQLLPVCGRFREVVAQCLCQPGHQFARFGPVIGSAIDPDSTDQAVGLSLAEKIMLSDTAFWKSIRILWHQLFMSSLLLELEPKKQFARLFSRNYARMLRDYVTDDHEHRVSVLSLSVQIYTVPSIAAMLIEQEGALAAIGNAFLELNQAYHSSGRFKFDTTPNTMPNTAPFKRSYMALHDLDFLLSGEPCWTAPMRRQFVAGAEVFCKLLKRMQNMDSIIRQVVQHIEYEPGWDTGIKFELQVRPLIKQVLEWAITDREVYVAVLNVALALARDSFEYYANAGDKQNSNPLTNSLCTTVRRHYADKSAMVWDYNVGRKEISLHTPLSRFVAAMLLHLPRHGLWDEYLDYGSARPGSGRLTAHRLNPESMMELALRTQVLLGQFRAGMWRRNGYSLINQIMSYQNPHFRQTAYDLDVLTLQLGAAMIDPNEFMIHLMYKYNVDRMLDEQQQQEDEQQNSPSKRNEDSTRHQITLLEEFLRLIYTILVERYTLGLGAVTAEQCIQNEVIQWLCKQPMSHSELLSRMTVTDHDESYDLEDLILEVADFQRSTSSSNTAGRYVLKEQYYQRFNPFFYHYTRQDQSSALECQLRRLKRLASDNTTRQHGSSSCCPPPPLPDFVEPYQAINELLLCDVTLAIIRAILDKTLNLKDIYFSDFQFQQCLYLIGIALNEESKRPDRFKFSQKAIDCGIVSLLEQCSSRHIMARVEMHQNLYDWCLERFKQVIMGRDGSEPPSSGGTSGAGSAAGTVAADEDPEQERNRRRKMAAARKERILQQMQRQQRSFMKENENYFKENHHLSSQQWPGEAPADAVAPDEELPVALGPGRRGPGSFSATETYTCILCLETQDVNVNNGRYLVLAGFIQRSTVLSKSRGLRQAWNEENLNCVWVPGADHNFGPFVNTCTHCMHNDCYEKYYETSVANERRRAAHRFPRNTFDLTKHEFLCPLCECLSNLTIPIMPSTGAPEPIDPSLEIGIDPWLTGMLALLQNCGTVWISEPDQLVNHGTNNGFSKSFRELMAAATAELPGELGHLLEQLQSEYKANALAKIDAQPGLRDIRNRLVQTFYRTVYRVTKTDGPPVAKDEPLEMIQCLSWSISYTIQVLERTMRVDWPVSLSELVDTRPYQCLRALVGLVRLQLNFVPGEHPRRIFLYLANYLLVNTVYLSSPYHLLELDSFSLLVSLMAYAPAFFDGPREAGSADHDTFLMPLANSMDKNLVQLALTFHLAQIILTNRELKDMIAVCSSSKPQAEPMEVDYIEHPNEQPESLKLALFCKDVLMAAGHCSSSAEQLLGGGAAGQLAAIIKRHLVPFLRCAALLVYFLTGTRWPKRLWSQKSPSGVEEPPISATEEYRLLCHYLAIDSDLGFVCQSVNLRQLALSWTRHHKLLELFSEAPCDHMKMLRAQCQYLEQPHSLNRLIDLPHDFSDLINSVANFTCPNSNGEESRSPTMCLICGEILCSQNYCCQRRIAGQRKELVGACTYHSQQCSASVGIFLRIRDNKILLLTSRGRGCYLPSPYLNKYGETDSGLFRGDPMFLSRPAYDKLYRLWLRHGIPEEIVHLMETSNSLASVNWNIM